MKYITLLLYVSITLSITSALKDQQVPNGEEDEERHATALRKGSRSARAHGEIVRLDNNDRLKREDWWKPKWKKPSFKINLKSSDGKACLSSSTCKSNCCYKAICQSRCPPNLPNDGACWHDSDCSSKRCNHNYKCIDKSKNKALCTKGNNCASGHCFKAICVPSPPPNVPNSYPCYKDSDCSSKRCNRWWKCQAKAKFGEYCRYGLVNGYNRNKNECEDGLNCAFPSNKCYHYPRHVNEPCNSDWDYDNCAYGLCCTRFKYTCDKLPKMDDICYNG